MRSSIFFIFVSLALPIDLRLLSALHNTHGEQNKKSIPQIPSIPAIATGLAKNSSIDFASKTLAKVGNSIFVMDFRMDEKNSKLLLKLYTVSLI